MRPESDSKALYKGAFILTIAALCTKILSAIYRVPFQNMVGDVGFYIYQQVYPFYGAALVLSTYGFPVIISKLYTEQTKLKEKNGVQELFMISFLILLAIGFMGFSILYWGADWLAVQMDDPELAFLLKIVSITFLIFPITSIFRGYFQGKGNMMPTAAAQVGEQLIRVLTIFFAAFFLTKKGYSLYIVGGGAIFGSITGGIVAVAILIIFFYTKGRKEFFSKTAIDFKRFRKIARSLIFQGIAVCISSMLLIFMQLADSLNLYSILVSSGFNSEEAKGLKGIYDRGQPLIQLGTIVATSMSLTLVPFITNEKLQENTAVLHDKIRLALRLGVFIGMAAAAGLWNIMKPANIMLFENADGSDVLSLLSLLILLGSLIITITAVLQGLGFLLYPAVVILCGFGLKYSLNFILIPLYGTLGAAAASCITLILILLCLYARLRSYLKIPLIGFRFFLIIGLAIAAMIAVLQIYLHVTGFLYEYGHIRLIAGFQALSAVILGGVTYLLVVLKGNTFNEAELAMLPMAHKLLIMLPKKKRGGT